MEARKQWLTYQSMKEKKKNANQEFCIQQSDPRNNEKEIKKTQINNRVHW